MDRQELDQVKQQLADMTAGVRRLLCSASSQGADLVKIYEDLQGAEYLVSSPMIEAPEEDRPITGVDDYVRATILAAQGILEAVPA